MAYTICDLYGDPKPIRFLMTNAQDEVRVGGSFKPFWWSCDACNPSSKRYEVTFRADQQDPQGYAWYMVITSDDSQADIDLKIAHYVKVIAARHAMNEAQRQWEILNR